MNLNQPSFAAGELSPELRRRIDIQKYSVGVAEAKNMYVLPRGGLQSRPGTKYLGTPKAKCRLRRFTPTDEVSYMLEFSANCIRIWKDDVLILNGSTPLEITTTYTATEVFELSFNQSTDTLYITHPLHAPATLVRNSDTSWTLSTFDFTGGPLRTENDTSTTMYIYSDDGAKLKGDTVSLIASAATFVSGHVGGVFALRHIQCSATYTRYVAAGGGVYTSDNFPVWGEWELNISPGTHGIDNTSILIYKSVDNGATWYNIHTIPTQPADSGNVIVTGTADDACLLQIRRDNVDDDFTMVLNSYGHSQWACVRIASFTSSTMVHGTLLNDFDMVNVPMVTWAEGEWSTYRGWPNCSAFYQDRLFFGKSNQFWGSDIADYSNFSKSIPIQDDELVSQRLLGRSVNSIRWMIPKMALMFLTSSSEWTVEPSNTGAFGPADSKVKDQTEFGCNGTVEPVVVGDTVLFLTKYGTEVRGWSYDDINGKQINDLSIMANHLFDGYTITGWAYQKHPHSILWAARSDGALLSLTIHKEHEVFAWTQHYTGAQEDDVIESIEAIPGVGQDDVWMSVLRTINNESVRFIERFNHRDISEQSAFCGLDCSTTYSGTATTTITGLDRFNGQTVSVMSNGLVFDGKLVSDGTITLTQGTSLCHVGIPYEWKMTTLQLDASGKNGFTSARTKLVNGVTIAVLNSQGGKAGIGQFSDFTYPNGTSKLELFSGDIDQGILGMWDKAGQFTLKGHGGYPMHIINIQPRLEIGA